MVFVLFVPKRYIILHKSVLNRAYSFLLVYPCGKQGIDLINLLTEFFFYSKYLTAITIT